MREILIGTIKKLCFATLFGLAVLFLAPHQAVASHVMGSDITYRCLSKWKYEVTLTVYRDCSGIALGTNHSLYVKCNTSTWTKSYAMTFIGSKDITGINKGCSAKSKCVNGGTFSYGIEEHTFKVTIDLSSISCSEFTLSWSSCCRNNAINTGASGKGFYTEAILYTNLSDCNSSPTFTSDAATLICSGTLFTFNNGAIDTTDNGDSLSYSLDDPLSAAGVTIPYTGQWSATKPVTFDGFPNASLPSPKGFHLDAVTGNISFTPTTNQVSVMVLVVTEWRKIGNTMQVIGITRRDLQILVINCGGNDPPEIIGTSKETCPGEPVCINISATDKNPNDKVTLSWNGAIKGATFTSYTGSKYDSATVCWTPTQSDVSNVPYTFTITARDNGCPFTGQSVKAFTIFVYEPPNALSKFVSLGCGRVAVDFVPDKFYNSLTQTWIARDMNGKVVASSTNKQDILYLPKGKIAVTLELKTQGKCATATTDTIEVKEQVEVDIPADTATCINQQMKISAITYNGIPPFKYVWNTSPADTLTSLTIDKNRGTKFWITVKDAIGCIWTDTVQVRWDTLPVAAFNHLPACYLSPTQFINSTTTQSGDTYTSKWDFGDGTTTGNQKSPSHIFPTINPYTVKLQVVSDKGCTDSISHTVTIYQPPVAKFSVNPVNRCQKTNLFGFTDQSIYNLGALVQHWDFGDGDTLFSNNPSHTFDSAGIYTVKLISETDHGCKDSMTIPVEVFPNPVANFAPNDSDQCLNTNAFIFNNLTTITKGTVSHSWELGNEGTSAVASPSFSFARDTAYMVKLVATSDKSCTDTISRKMVVFPVPVADFSINNPAQCVNADEFRFTNKSAIKNGTIAYRWYFGTGDSSAEFEPLYNYTTDGNYAITLKAISNNNCEHTLSKTVWVIPKPAALFSVNDSDNCVDPGIYTFTNGTTLKYPSPLTYSWDYGNGTTSTAVDSVSLYPSHGKYLVTLIARSKENCLDTFIKPLKVFPRPVSSLSIPADSQCLSGNLFEFFSQSTIDSGIMAYTWFFGNGQTDGRENTTYSYPADGDYRVSLKSYTPDGCWDSVTMPVKVEPMPQPMFTIDNPSQCIAGNRFVFTNKSTINSGSMMYSWDFADGRTSNKTDTAISYTNDDNYLIALVATSNFGCVDSVKNPLVVEPSPRPSFTINDTDQCLQTQQFDFINTSTIKTGTFNTAWKFSDGKQLLTTDAKGVTFVKDARYKVRLVLVSSNNCSDSIEKEVVVYPHPDATFSGLHKYFCIDNPAVQLVPKVPGGWFKANNINGDIYTPNINGPDTVLYHVERNGCPGEFSLPTIVHPLPSLELGNDTTLCLHSPLFLDAGFPNARYLWQDDATTGPKYMVLKPGKYRVTLFHICDTLTDEITVKYLDYDCNYFIPNAFTPNDDGLNDVFLPRLENVAEMRMQIFDRWGAKIFESSDTAKGWDGTLHTTPVPDGVYIWHIQLMFNIKGYIYRQAVAGNVTLLR